jgi:superfamily I DNA/RNA helicase
MAHTFIKKTKAAAGRVGGSTEGRVWSVQQQNIIGWCEGKVGDECPRHLIVRARAGTGKTTTIIEAVNHIRPPGRILLCAFNKRIQLELAARLKNSRAEARTLHSLGFGILRANVGEDVKIDDDVEWERIDVVLAKRWKKWGKLELGEEGRRGARKLIAWAKGVEPFATRDELLALAIDVEETAGLVPAVRETVATVAYLSMRRAANFLDYLKEGYDTISYDDMIFVAVVNGWARPLYRWVICDESQDMNASQLLLAQAVLKEDGHLVFVGDEKQAIYGFRGADSGCLDRLKAELGTDELPLTVTYRCPRLVVAEAQRLVGDFTAAESAPEGVVRRTTLDKALHELDRGDVVLSRVNAPLVGICLALIRQNKPGVVAGRDIGKGLLATMAKIKAGTIPDFLTGLRAWEVEQEERIKAKAGKVHRTAQVERALVDMRDRVECLAAIALSADPGAGLDWVRARIVGLFEDVKDRSKVITCSSIHKAKGLEWPRVFLLTDTLYRGAMGWGKSTVGEAIGGQSKLEVDVFPADSEERNLHYVGVTRAMQELVLVQGEV